MLGKDFTFAIGYSLTEKSEMFTQQVILMLSAFYLPMSWVCMLGKGTLLSLTPLYLASPSCLVTIGVMLIS